MPRRLAKRGDMRHRNDACVAARRLARVRVVNIEQPIDLYEIVAQPPNDWQQRCERYSEALEALEHENVEFAEKCAKQMSDEFDGDTAITMLAQRVQEAKRKGLKGDTSIWRLPGK